MGIYMRKSSNWTDILCKPCLITRRYCGWDWGRIRVFCVTTFLWYGDIHIYIYIAVNWRPLCKLSLLSCKWLVCFCSRVSGAFLAHFWRIYLTSRGLAMLQKGGTSIVKDSAHLTTMEWMNSCNGRVSLWRCTRGRISSFQNIPEKPWSSTEIPHSWDHLGGFNTTEMGLSYFT